MVKENIRIYNFNIIIEKIENGNEIVDSILDFEKIRALDPNNDKKSKKDRNEWLMKGQSKCQQYLKQWLKNLLYRKNKENIISDIKLMEKISEFGFQMI